MPHLNSNYSTLFAAIANGATIVTANRRLARWLRSAFDSYQEAQNATVWRSADILPWSAWLMRLWNEAQEKAPSSSRLQRVLRPNQALALWERIITQSSYADELLQIRTTARQAQLAWSLLHEWRIDLVSTDFNVNEECRAFYAWAQGFSTECRRLNAIDDSLLPDSLRPFIEQGVTDIAPHILLAGFDALTPQQAQFFEWLASRDHTIEHVDNASQRDAPVQRISTPSTEAEIELAARWARHLLQQDSQLSIGIVALNLQQSRAQIERIFTEVCHPAATLITTPNAEIRAFNISLGLPLGNYPVIHSALLALRIAHNAAALDDISYLLRTPFIAGAEHELSGRALLDVWLRERGDLRLDLSTLLESSLKSGPRSAPPHLPILFERLAAFIGETQRMPRYQAPSAWAATCGRLLNRLGWPGERSLNSEEFQTVAAWQECLSELATLDDCTTPRITFNQALSMLVQLANDTIFQPQSDPAPIQIMGMLETSGLTFDAMWVMGLHDTAWPPPAHPNPFLPLALQQKFGLPHSSSARELIFARTLTQRLWASATQVIASYPVAEGDQALRASPLLQDCIHIDAQQIAFDAQPSFSESVFRSRSIETLLDAQATPLAPGTLVSGGTAVIKHQAACPFRAFAQFRLGANPMPSPHPGLEPRERGILIHAALEYTWKTLSSLEALHACSDDALLRLVHTAVARALTDMATQRPTTLTAAFLAIEQQRLEQILLAWLALERDRAPFTVAAFEQKQLLTVGQLQFKGKIDRLDRLSDGRYVIIDYKTSNTSPGDWFGPRPKEPQMPIYGVFHDGDVAALMFGQVKLGAMKMLGLASDSGVSPQIDNFSDSKYALEVSTWPDLMQHWKTLLEGLSENFRLGDARVDPKESATCLSCHLTALCRINERELEVDDND